MTKAAKQHPGDRERTRKAVTMVITPPMALTTKTSPLIAPRAATPWVSRKRKAEAADHRAVAHAELADPGDLRTAAPCQAKLKPRMPMLKSPARSSSRTRAPRHRIRMPGIPSGRDFARRSTNSGSIKAGAGAAPATAFHPVAIRNSGRRDNPHRNG